MHSLIKSDNIYIYIYIFVYSQRDGTLSAGRSAYINYSGMLQQFVQAYISKQQAINMHKPHLILQSMLKYFNLI